MNNEAQTVFTPSLGVIQYRDDKFLSAVIAGDALAAFFIHLVNNVWRLKEHSADFSAALFHTRFIEKMLLQYEEATVVHRLALPYDIASRRHLSQRLNDIAGGVGKK